MSPITPNPATTNPVTPQQQHGHQHFPAQPKRLLVIPLRYIGDTILTVPLLRNLHLRFPDARLDVMASRTAAPLLTPCPYLQTVHIEPSSKFELLSLLRNGQYDAVFLLRKSFTMALLCKLAGIPVVVGYDKQRFPFGYKRWGLGVDVAVRYPSLHTETPQAISHLQLLTAVTPPDQQALPLDPALELWSAPDDEQALNQLLQDLANNHANTAAPLAVIHAASASHGKTLPIKAFRASALRLMALGYQVIFTGTASDQPLYEKLQQELQPELQQSSESQTSSSQLLPCLNLAGLTTLRQTVALYKRIQVLVTVDSSPLHMGLACGVPHIVGVYGPTNEKQWGFYPGVNAQPIAFTPVFKDLPCRPCYAKVCAHNNCRVTLTEDEISRALTQTLQH